MEPKKIRVLGALLVVALWAALAGFAWFAPAKESSAAERRPLSQMPEISGKAILDSSFMEDFEEYSLDQFPLRDQFRQMKALFHNYILQQRDNNNIYIIDGYAAKLEYPISQTSLDYATKIFQKVYDKYLKACGGNIYFSVVPDKGYYLAEENGYPAMDYSKLFSHFQQQLTWAEYVDLTDTLDVTDYYRTDTHWRQEKLTDTAAKLCQAMGINAPRETDFTAKRLERPFYGVYYGQAALPMEAEELFIMQSDVLSDCKVYNYENGKTFRVYDMTKMGSKDLYDVYLSGSVSLVRIDNPNATTDKELIVFRDSFGSSLVPLLVHNYASVTLVDLRYVSAEFLGQFLDFHGQDVLMLYSTLILNSSFTLK